jgi:hypothetical protein
MVPPGKAPSRSPRRSKPAAFPLVGTVVVVVAVVEVVAGARLPAVVEVVSCPRLYLPSSVPPQPAPNRPQTTITVVARLALGNAKSPPDPSVRKRRSLCEGVASWPLGSVLP